MKEINGWVLIFGNKVSHYFTNAYEEGAAAKCGYFANAGEDSMERWKGQTDRLELEARHCPKCAAKLRADARRAGRAS